MWKCSLFYHHFEFKCNLAVSNLFCYIKTCFQHFFRFNHCFIHFEHHEILRNDSFQIHCSFHFDNAHAFWKKKDTNEVGGYSDSFHSGTHPLTRTQHILTRKTVFFFTSFLCLTLKWKRKCTSRANNLPSVYDNDSGHIDFGVFFCRFALLAYAIQCIEMCAALATQNNHQNRKHTVLHLSDCTGGWWQTQISSCKCSTINDETNNYLPFSFTKLHLALAVFYSSARSSFQRVSFFYETHFSPCSLLFLPLFQNKEKASGKNLPHPAYTLLPYKNGSTS